MYCHSATFALSSITTLIMKLIDTHTHPQMSQYESDRDAVLQRALESGVEMICVGVDLESSKSAIELAHAHEGIWASVGLHPNDNLSEVYSNEPYEALAGDSKVVAIGEIGLDYYRTPDKTAQEIQVQRFKEQLKLALRLKKPVIIHCRDAHEDMTEILEAFEGEGLRGVIHSFTGTWGEAQLYLKLGFYIGFNGIVTFARQYDETLTAIPAERILLETDAPYLTPEPFRGKRNESAHLLHVAQKIADIRGVSLEEFATQTTKNAQALFEI